MSEGLVLVTGGSGLLGGAVMRALLRRGLRVLAFGINPASGGLPDDPALEIVRGDMREMVLFERCVKRVDRVIHLASIGSVDEGLTHSLDGFDVSVEETRRMLELCAGSGRPVVLASTSEIYGKNQGVLSEGSDRVIGPSTSARSRCALSMMAAEELALAFGARGLAFAILRYFNVYGPRMDAPGPGRVIRKFARRLLAGEPLLLVDGGQAVRSFCYVDDAAEATVSVALALPGDERVRGRAFNVGRAEPVSVRELAARMIALAGRGSTEEARSVDVFGPGFEVIDHREPNVSALEEAIGFRASIDLDEGLRRTLAAWSLLAERPPSPPRREVPWIRPVFEPDRALLSSYERSLRSGRATNDGPEVRAFEREAAAWLGVPEVVAVSTGADALLLLVHALGLRGKVVLPAFTYIATLSAFALRGLEPVFCDVEPDTFTLSPSALERVLEREPTIAAIAPVNVFGVPPDLEAIGALAKRSGAALVYDNAHGFGSAFNGCRVPSEPMGAAFSLHATKVMPAVEGGLVVSADPALLAEVRRLRTHGLNPADIHSSSPGYNSKMDELRAATGRHTLRGLDAAIERRRAYAERLRAFLERECAGAYITQRVPPGVASNAQNLGVLCRAADAVGIDAVIADLASNGVEARRYFYPPLHTLAAHRGSAALPATDRVASSNVCLPLHSRMSAQDLEVIEAAVLAAARLAQGAREARS